MRKTAMAAKTSAEGFLLLDSAMVPIFINSAAAQILAYPEGVQGPQDLAKSVAEKICPLLLGKDSRGAALVTKFQSGKRLYRCRSFYVNALSGEAHHPSLAVLLERPSTASTSIADLSERFNLTFREQEVAQYIFQGLTSKEIAVKMGISANTVKAFLRLIMFKMGVSTRSAIAGKVFNSGAYRGVHLSREINGV